MYVNIRHVPFQSSPLFGPVIVRRASLGPGEDLDVNAMLARHVLFQSDVPLGAEIAHRAGEFQGLDVNIMLFCLVPFQMALNLYLVQKSHIEQEKNSTSTPCLLQY